MVEEVESVSPALGKQGEDVKSSPKKISYTAPLKWVKNNLSLIEQFVEGNKIFVGDQIIVEKQGETKYYDYNRFSKDVAIIQFLYWKNKAEELSEKNRILQEDLSILENHVCHEIVAYDSGYYVSDTKIIKETKKQIEDFLREAGFKPKGGKSYDYGYDLVYSKPPFKAVYKYHWNFNGGVWQKLIITLNDE